MPALVPGIHALLFDQDVDGRPAMTSKTQKPAHRLS
jgi:hypothetical protein